MRIIILLLALSTFFGASAGIKTGNKKALLIGISKYQENTGWHSITCDYDIKYLKEALIQSDFESENINILKDSLATRAGIIKSLTDMEAKAKTGDVIFIHFSGHGLQVYDDNNDEKDGFDECIVPYDSYVRGAGQKQIRDDELIELLNKIRLKIGKAGQLVFSIDASHSGNDGDVEIKKDSITGSTIIIGRGGVFDEFKLENENNENFSSIIILTATVSRELSFETQTELGEPIGVYTYALYKSLINKKYKNYKNFTELYDTLIHNIQKLPIRQKPTIAGHVDKKVFVTEKEKINTAKKPNNAKCYIVSIGINNYKSNPPINLKYENCYNDAKSIAEFCENSFERFADDTNKIFKSILLNEKATSKEIIEVLNKVISLSSPDDYFIFTFSGMTYTLHDTAGNKQTYFYTSDIKNISDTNEVKKKAISLEKLKNLIDLISANNQLLLTEAGSTENFQREFIKILIESSPTISSISKRNRIIIVPKDFGRDDFYCDYKKIESGPINYFITTLNAKYNLFNLFGEKNRRSAVEKAIIKNELDCSFSDIIYTQIFYEREFIENLQYYMPESSIKTRGGHTINNNKKAIKSRISQKHALVIGTNLYIGKPQWSDLSNPEIDARIIADELKNSFGFNTKLLLNTSQDSIYAALFKYSKTLDTNDQLLIFFAGHGDFDEKYFDDGFIVLNNSLITKTDPYRKSYIKHTELERMINKLPPKQILVIMDVCFGGTFDKRVLKQESRSRGDMYDDLETSEFVNEKLKYKTRIFITSGGKKEVPDGYKGKHSPFALKLLEALRTKGGNNGYLTATDLHAFVQKLPSGPLMGDFGDHQFGGEFILIPKVD